MSISGIARVTCPACGRAQDAPLVQSINARSDAAVVGKLLAGELNVLACACGARAQLAATVLFVDPDADYTCQVVPGDDVAIEHAISRFAAAGVTGTRRVVPSLNALIEKVKLLQAGLADWAIEMTKVLLLATLASGRTSASSAAGGQRGTLEPAEVDLDRVMLFDRVDRDARVVHWVRFDEPGVAQPAASPLAAYDKLVARESLRPPRDEARIDRAWAVAAVQRMIANVN